jgi:hypothetical protein
MGGSYSKIASLVLDLQIAIFIYFFIIKIDTYRHLIGTNMTSNRI